MHCFITLTIAALATGQPATSPGSPGQWTEEAVLRVIDEATTRSPAAFSYTRSLEQSQAIAVSPLVHAAANADPRSIFANDPLSSLPARSSGTEFVVSDGDRIGITSHQKIATEYLTESGVAKASSWEETGPIQQLYTPIGWYSWYPPPLHRRVGVDEDENVPFFTACHVFSPLWDGRPAIGLLSDRFFERYTFEAASFDEGVLAARFTFVDTEGITSAEPGFESVSTVRIKMAPGEGPRLLSEQQIGTFLKDGERVASCCTEYTVREWLRVGDLNLPALATDDLYIYATWFKERYGQDFWAPLGMMYRNTMRHTNYQQLEPEEARAMLPELPTGDGVSGYITSHNLAYILGEAAIWIDGEPYALPEPLMEHPVNGIDHLLEEAVYIPPPEGMNPGAPGVASATASSAGDWVKGTATILGIVALIGIAGRALLRRWVAA